MIDRLTHLLLGLTFALLGVLVGLGGLGMLAAALYQVLTGFVPPAAAAAIVGVLALILMALLFLFARALAATPRPSRGGGESNGDVSALSGLITDVEPILRRHGTAVAGGAFAAGLVLGISPRARRALWRLVAKGMK